MRIAGPEWELLISPVEAAANLIGIADYEHCPVCAQIRLVFDLF